MFLKEGFECQLFIGIHFNLYKGLPLRRFTVIGVSIFPTVRNTHRVRHRILDSAKLKLGSSRKKWDGALWKTPSGVVNAPSKTAPGNTSESDTSASGINN
jgi:hypothetical protein